MTDATSDPAGQMARPMSPALSPSVGGLRNMGIRKTLISGALIVTAFFGGFGAWAVLAPLDSAAIAAGQVGIDTRRKTIQHLEGGIVGAILVREGDAVERGQALIELDDTRARASRKLLDGQWGAAKAMEARLIAERDGFADVAFPDALAQRSSEIDVSRILEGQLNIFTARKDAVTSQTRILGQQVAQMREEIEGLGAEITAQTTQLNLIAEERDAVQALLKKGFARKPRLLALQREAAEIEGRRAQNRAAIARAKQSIGETKLRIQDIHTARHSEVVEELREVQAQLVDLAERINAAADVLKRTVVYAPVSGVVVNLQVATQGGVIGPGEPLMDIVPSNDKLVIEARVKTTDIDIVHPGLPAQVRLTSFNQRTTPVLEGIVERVSADSMVDERTGEAYYLTRINLTEDSRLPDSLILQPGMPAEVMIVTGNRTLVEYMVKPIRESLSRAFREE